MQTYYKVVTRAEADKRVSALSRIQVEYKPGEWAEAPIGGLFVFTSQEHAIVWRGCTPNQEIWECECEEPVSKPDLIEGVPDPNFLTLLWAERFWSNDPTTFCDFVFPRNTALFKRVKLIKKIDTDI